MSEHWMGKEIKKMEEEDKYKIQTDVWTLD